MKIVLLFGNESNQRALAQKIHLQFPVAAIVIESRKSKVKFSFLQLAQKLVSKILFRKIDHAWFGMRSYFESKYPQWPDVEKINVENINEQSTIALCKKIEPDLILVSGTRLIKEPLLSLQPKVGILNLHTGLSPYIKGGPNCTNWCIATGQFEYIGNTVMWIDKGIDTGDLLYTETCSLSTEQNLKEVHISVMRHAHELYIKSIRSLIEGDTVRVRQASIAKGKTYYSKDWNFNRRIDLIKNRRSFFKKIKNQELKNKSIDIITVSPSNK